MDKGPVKNELWFPPLFISFTLSQRRLEGGLGGILGKIEDVEPNPIYSPLCAFFQVSILNPRECDQKKSSY